MNEKLKRWFDSIPLFDMGLTPHCTEEDIVGIADTLWDRRRRPDVSHTVLLDELRKLRDYAKSRIDLRVELVRRWREDTMMLEQAINREIEQNGESSEQLDDLRDTMTQAIIEIVEWAKIGTEL